jgi:hypothetical protein
VARREHAEDDVVSGGPSAAGRAAKEAERLRARLL